MLLYHDDIPYKHSSYIVEADLIYDNFLFVLFYGFYIIYVCILKMRHTKI